MTLTLLGILAVTLAATCWYAAERPAPPLLAPAKAGTLAALLLLALALGASGAPSGIGLLVGLTLSLVGDIALVRPDRRAFEVGLGAFLLAHIAYAVAFAAQWFSPLGLMIAVLVGAPFGALSARRVHRAAAAAEGPMLAGAVAAYTAVLLLMVAAAGATGDPLILLGAVLFLLSDTVLALDRFVAPRAHADLVVLVLYHLAQAALVVGLLR